MMESWPEAIPTTVGTDPYGTLPGEPPLVEGAGQGDRPKEIIEIPEPELQSQGPESQEDSNFAVAHDELDEVGKDSLAKALPSSSKSDMPPPPLPSSKLLGLSQLGITTEMSKEQIKEAVKVRMALLEHFGFNEDLLFITTIATEKMFFKTQLQLTSTSLPFHQATPS